MAVLQQLLVPGYVTGRTRVHQQCFSLMCQSTQDPLPFHQQFLLCEAVLSLPLFSHIESDQVAGSQSR